MNGPGQTMHRLLERQLRRQFGSIDNVPESLRPLFAVIDESYAKADVDRELLSRSLDEMSRELTERNDALRRERDELSLVAKRLEEAHNQLLQSEKMASIGQLAAGVAHEINNPVGYVNSNVNMLGEYIDELLELVDAYASVEHAIPQEQRALLLELRSRHDLAYLKTDLKEMLEESREGLGRVKKIVEDLKDFSRADEGAFDWADLHGGIDSTLNIAANEIKYKADVVKAYGDIPQVECLHSQLNQVFMNLLVNAAQAMSGETRGTITVRTGSCGDDAVWVEIADNGSGIARENLKRIFDPFFTTKPVGQGTGLGLSLSYGIVQKHHGRIEVESEIGKGTTFRVYLPVRQPKVA